MLQDLVSVQVIVSFGVNVKPLALSPLSFFHWSNRMEEPTLLIDKSRGRFPGGVVYLSHIIHIMGMGFYSVPQRHQLHLVFLLLQFRSDWKSNLKRYMEVNRPWSPPDRCHLKLNFYRMISFIDFDRSEIDINRSHNYFLYRFLSIHIERLISITNDCYRLSVYRLTNLLSLIFARLHFHDFHDLKNFAKLKFREKKVPRKLKTRNLLTYIKNLCLSFPSARSLHTSRRAKISVQRMPLFLIIWLILLNWFL